MSDEAEHHGEEVRYEATGEAAWLLQRTASLTRGSR